MNQNIAARSPLRVSFAGGGTDVEPFASTFGSAIVSATINLYADVKATRTNGDEFIIDSIDTGEKLSLTAWNDKDLQSHLIGACGLIIPERERKGLHLSFSSPVPPGSGLGASSALVVAMLKALMALQDRTCTNTNLAELAFKIERQEMAIEGGFQDQYASAFGGLNFIESRASTVTVSRINVSNNFLEEIQSHLILANLSLPRQGQHIIADQQKNIQNQNSKSLAAAHKQLELGHQMKDAFVREDLNLIGTLMSESWNAKRDFSDKISTPQIDKIMNELKGIGILGAKITGAGGGGHLLILADSKSKNGIRECLHRNNIGIQDFRFTIEGAQSWSI